MDVQDDDGLAGRLRCVRVSREADNDIEYLSAWYTKLHVGYVGYVLGYFLHRELQECRLIVVLTSPPVGWEMHPGQSRPSERAGSAGANTGYVDTQPERFSGLVRR
jgi:hypothetical protein